MNRREAAETSRGDLVAATLAGSWRTSMPPLELSLEDLNEITPLLYNSGAAALGWRRIRDTALSTTPSAEVLHQGYRLQALQVAIRLEKIELVHRLLQAARINAILMKGWAVAGFYPELPLRPLGDIDLLVRPKDYKASNEILARPEARGCWVDLHNQITELKDRSHDELFSRSRIVSLRDTQIRVLSLEDHLALLTIHLLKHGAWRPLWLCDIAAIVESLPNDFDWNICLGSDKRQRSWISASIALAHQLLGANIDKVPLPARAKYVPEWLRESVFKQWGNLFPGDHLPVQPRPLMANVLTSPRGILNETRERWPDSITATFNMSGPINNFPRLPYKLGDFSARAGRYLIGYLRRAAVRRTRVQPSGC
jgi:hypothetical protein